MRVKDLRCDVGEIRQETPFSPIQYSAFKSIPFPLTYFPPIFTRPYITALIASIVIAMSTIRILSKHTRSLSRTLPVITNGPMTSRAFHSPFAVLSSSPSTPSSTSPLTSPPTPDSNVANLFYEKQLDFSSEPKVSSSGQRMYVVSEPDPSNTPYQVPSGAYPTSVPYQNYTPTEQPIQRPRSSTSSSFAHPYLSRAVPQNESGVMDASTTRKGEGELANRNPQPDEPKVAEKFSALGVDNAWKARK